MKKTAVEICAAAASAAGWSGRALVHLAAHDDFHARLQEANEIRGLVNLIGPQMREAGYDPEGAAEYFVTNGCSLQSVREDSARILAEWDEATAIDTSPRGGNLVDPYAARVAEIDALAAKTA
jgi:hypothetical protein